MPAKRKRTIPIGEEATVQHTGLVDATGVAILKDMHRAERRHAEHEHQIPAESDAEPSAKPRFSKQTNLLIFVGVIALIFIILFGIRIFNRPEILTPDELHARNLAGELEPEQGYVYRGFSFVWYDNLWFTQMHKPGTDKLYNIQLHFGPRDLEDVELGGGVEQFTVVPNTYVTFDPTAEPLSYVALAAGELSLNLAVVLNITPVPACTKNQTQACAKLPTINCAQDTVHPIIALEQGGAATVTRDRNCLTLSGKDLELVRAVDRALLLWMEIMPWEGIDG